MGGSRTAHDRFANRPYRVPLDNVPSRMAWSARKRARTRVRSCKREPALRFAAQRYACVTSCTREGLPTQRCREGGSRTALERTAFEPSDCRVLREDEQPEG